MTLRDVVSIVCTVDVVLLTLREGALHVLLVQRDGTSRVYQQYGR